MKSCSDLLEIFAKRGPECKVYRNIFDTLWGLVGSNSQNKKSLESTAEKRDSESTFSSGKYKGSGDTVISDWEFNEDFWKQVMLDINK